MNNQDNLLYTYGFFGEKILTEYKQIDFRKLIDAKEPTIRTSIENFKESCRSRSRQSELSFFLKNYETYLVTKQTLFKESQRTGSNWIRDNVPIDPAIYKPTD